MTKKKKENGGLLRIAIIDSGCELFLMVISRGSCFFFIVVIILAKSSSTKSWVGYTSILRPFPMTIIKREKKKNLRHLKRR